VIVTNDPLLAGAADAATKGVPQPTNLEMRCIFDSMTAGARDIQAIATSPSPRRADFRRPASRSRALRAPGLAPGLPSSARSPGHPEGARENPLDLNAVTTAIGQVGLTLVVIAVIVVALEGLLYLLLVRLLHNRYAVPIMLVAPAALGLLILVGWPLLWELNVSFTKMSLRNFRDPGFLGLGNDMFVGIQQYTSVFTEPVLKLTGFWQLFAQTVLWTSINVATYADGAGLCPPQDAGQGIYRPSSSCPGRSPR
jgi:hypothetical protein